MLPLSECEKVLNFLWQVEEVAFEVGTAVDVAVVVVVVAEVVATAVVVASCWSVVTDQAGRSVVAVLEENSCSCRSCPDEPAFFVVSLAVLRRLLERKCWFVGAKVVVVHLCVPAAVVDVVVVAVGVVGVVDEGCLFCDGGSYGVWY